MAARTPRQVLEAVRDAKLEDEDGESLSLFLRPGLSLEEIERFEAERPGPLPHDIRDLLTFTRGFELGSFEGVDFLGGLGWAFESAFPHALPIAADGFGNFWVVDVHRETGDWAPVYFACHDPPVVVLQSPTLAGFITEIVKHVRPDASSALEAEIEQAAMRIWSESPGLVPVAEAFVSGDELLRAFAEELADGFDIMDLRAGEVGSGFPLGRAGPNTKVIRYGAHPIFAIERGR